MTGFVLAFAIACSATAFAGSSGLQYSRTALFPGFDGKWCKVQPSVATDGKRTALLTYQMLNLAGSDVFSGQFVTRSADGGATWSEPVKIPESDDICERGLRVARYVNVCHFAGCGLWSAMGSATMYDGDARPYQKYVDGKPYCYPVQADVDAETGRIYNYRPMPFPFAYEFAMRFGQAVECGNGEVLMPFYYRPVGAGLRSQAVVVRYRRAASGWKCVEPGTPIAVPSLARGVGEPSLVRIGDKFLLTLRSDECGMVAESADGLHFDAPKKWTWEDGLPIGNANTQQHWMKIGGKLYLAYTRVTPTNGHVFRNRAPVFLAEVDVDRLCLKRTTEIPIVPERGARLGNFCCTEDGHGGAWLVTAEWMQPNGCERYGSDNSLWLAKVRENSVSKRNRGILLLTFDDALFHNWDKALPLFDRYGAHATFFVNGKLDDRLIAKMRTYQSYGHSVGLHSAHHASAAKMVAKKGVGPWLGEEIEPQLVALRKANLSVRNFAYPNSDRDENTDAALTPHFDHLRTGHIFGRDPAKNPLATCDAAFISRGQLTSSRVLWGMGFGSKFKGIADDLERGLERLAVRNEVLVLYSHDIMTKSDGGASICNNTTLTVLKRILAKAYALDIAVIGFDEIGNTLQR